MPSRKRTTTAATAKNRSRKNSPKHFVGCPCKKCKHDPTCTCPECGHNRLLTKAKMRSRGRKQDGGRVYLGMIDDESYYSPPVVAAAAAAAPPAPGPGGPVLGAPSYIDITTNMNSVALKNKLSSLGLAVASSVANATKINRNALITHYYGYDPTTYPLIV